MARIFNCQGENIQMQNYQLKRRKNGSYAILKQGTEKPVKPVVPNKDAAREIIKRIHKTPNYIAAKP